MFLTKDQLLNAQMTEVDVPGVGQVRLRPLSLSAMSAARETEDEFKQAAILIADTVCGEKGERLLTVSDVMETMPYSVADKLAATVADHSGLNGEDREVVRGN